MNSKALKLNGDTAIQLCTGTVYNDSFLVQHNMLMFALEGALQIKYGTFEYSIEKDHIEKFKKDSLLECSARLKSDYDKVKFLCISFKDDLLKEFVKLAQLPILRPTRPSTVTISSVNLRLLRFVDSLELYFREPENIDEYLTNNH